MGINEEIDASMMQRESREIALELARQFREALVADRAVPEKALTAVLALWDRWIEGLDGKLEEVDFIQVFVRMLRWVPYEPNEKFYRGEEILRWLAEAFYAGARWEQAHTVCELARTFVHESEMQRSSMLAIQDIRLALRVAEDEKDVPKREVARIPPPIVSAHEETFGGLIGTRAVYRMLHSQTTTPGPESPLAEVVNRIMGDAGDVDTERCLEPILRKDGKLKAEPQAMLEHLPANTLDHLADKAGRSPQSLSNWSSRMQEAGVMAQTDNGWVITEEGQRLLAESQSESGSNP